MSALQDQRRIVVGVDGSQEALRAVRWATTEAKRRRGVLRLVTAVDWTELAVDLPGTGQSYGDILRKQAENSLDEAVAAATEIDSDIEIERQVSVGFPTAVLAAESRHAGLLVVGEGGISRIASIVAGSVAIGVATQAACPVVIVRGEEPDAAAPVVVGVDASPVGEAAIAFAFEAASARRVLLVAVHTWGLPPGDVKMAPLWGDIIDEAQRDLAERLADGARSTRTSQ
jgi:nucleotide-binding universal stress UspA family protein